MIRKFHIHPESGNPSVCRAEQDKCPYGSSEEHYPSLAKAMAAYEAKLSGSALASHHRKREQAPVTKQALTSSLKWSGPPPEWLTSISDEEERMFGERTTEIIDVIQESPVGPLAVVYQSNSTKNGDDHIQLERGYAIPRITYQALDTGETHGYLSMTYVDDASVERSWGADEWTSLDYCDDAKGGSYGIRKWSDDETARSKLRTITGQETAEELAAVKKKIWVEAFKSFNQRPPGFDTSVLTWGSLVNLKEEHAPEGAKLDEDLEVIKKLADEELSNFKHDHGQPTIDFSRLEGGLKGKGFGTSLYVYGARKLAEKGLSLRGSGLQSPEAQTLWLRMERDRELPISTIAKTWSRSDEASECYVLDFTPERRATKQEEVRNASLLAAKQAQRDAWETEDALLEEDQITDWAE